MKAYKGFDKNLQCRGFQYEVGHEYETSEAEEALKPRNCGEFARFVRNHDCPGSGWCDNWGGLSLTEKYVCHPNYGVKAKKEVCDGLK